MRIAAISDLHGTFPKVPECDVLVVAGDLCPDGFGNRWARKDPQRQKAWFEDVMIPWLQQQPVNGPILVTWGNHDYCGTLYPMGITHLVDAINIVVDEVFDLDGTKFWLSPWSKQFMNWAWMKEDPDLGKEIYAKIPADVDVLVSHQPPYGCGDIYPDVLSGKMEHVGSTTLLYHIERVRPDVVICGHLHGGYGTYQVKGSMIYNVAVTSESCRLIRGATIIDYAEQELPEGQTTGIQGQEGA